jgi:hypothetical protein
VLVQALALVLLGLLPGVLLVLVQVVVQLPE